jgi:hypothetical protein
VAAASRFSLADARAAAAEDRTAEWVGDFLASPGSDNAVLAAALAQNRHWWAGPAEVPIDDLERLAGPEDDTLCPIEPAEWRDDVDHMEESLDEGWEPPPLLARYQDGRLLLEDGNHRYQALVEAGASHAWTLVFFDDPGDRDAWRAARAETGRPSDGVRP